MKNSKSFLTDKIETKHLVQHETKRNVLVRFVLIVLILLGYFIFISHSYGIQDGILVTILTWSFFVFCTPVADAGFLIDFPMRLVTRMRMLYSEIIIWFTAGVINLFVLIFAADMYSKTGLLIIFRHILVNPFPFWGIILISLVGTFISIEFGDELLDKVHHRDRKLYFKRINKFRWIIMIFLIFLVLSFYNLLLHNLGISISV